MSTLEIIKLVVIAAVVLVLVVYFAIKAIRNGWMKKIYDSIMAAIKEAEKSDKKGKEKKQFVLDAVEKQCEELGIPFNFIKGLIGKLIDMVISHYNVLSK